MGLEQFGRFGLSGQLPFLQHPVLSILAVVSGFSFIFSFWISVFNPNSSSESNISCWPVIPRLRRFLSAPSAHSTVQCYQISAPHSGHTSPRGAGSRAKRSRRIKNVEILEQAQLQTAV